MARKAVRRITWRSQDLSSGRSFKKYDLEILLEMPSRKEIIERVRPRLIGFGRVGFGLIGWFEVFVNTWP